jgi:hypothetical protein
MVCNPRFMAPAADGDWAATGATQANSAGTDSRRDFRVTAQISPTDRSDPATTQIASIG